MGLSITKDEFQLLRQLIENECGIEVREDKIYLIENRLTKLVLESGCETFGEFYIKASTQNNPGLKAKIVDAITTNETLWFRDEMPFQILREKLFPEFAEQIRNGTRDSVRIWSAACSTGQEPYSIAIILSELADNGQGGILNHQNISIYATDISSSALFLAKSARYDTIAMSRGMTEDYRQKYFEEQGRVCVLKDSIREMVTFEQFNLQNSFAQLGQFDIVMLRNVAIYFAHDFKIELFKKIARILNPGGYLFLGASEMLTGYSQDFARMEHGRGVYYQLKPTEGSQA